MIYSELLELLRPQPQQPWQAMFGTLTAVEPLTITVGDTKLTEGLFASRGTRFYEEDIGVRLALLPCEEGFLILFQAEEVGE